MPFNPGYLVALGKGHHHLSSRTGEDRTYEKSKNPLLQGFLLHATFIVRLIANDG